MLWVRVPPVIKRIIQESMEYLVDRLKQEINFRLKTEEQSAEIIQQLHESSSNLEERIKQLSRTRSSRSLSITHILNDQSQRSMESSPNMRKGLRLDVSSKSLESSATKRFLGSSLSKSQE